MKLAAKIMTAAQIIGKIEKNGVNQHFKFKYQAWDDVVPAVRDACATVGIALVPSMRLIASENGHSLVSVSVTVCDAESDETYVVESCGEAKGNDDKGLQKAYTSAYKYLLLKLFLIPVHGDDDPDGTTPAPKSASEPKRPPSGNQAMTAAVNRLCDITGMDKPGLKQLLGGLSVIEVDKACAEAKELGDVVAVIDRMKAAPNVD